MTDLTPLPELDQAALVTADLAYLEEPPGTSDQARVEAAIRAYLWHVENRRPLHPDGTGPTVGPSLNDYRRVRFPDDFLPEVDVDDAGYVRTRPASVRIVPRVKNPERPTQAELEAGVDIGNIVAVPRPAQIAQRLAESIGKTLSPDGLSLEPLPEVRLRPGDRVRLRIAGQDHETAVADDGRIEFEFGPIPDPSGD